MLQLVRNHSAFGPAYNWLRATGTAKSAPTVVAMAFILSSLLAGPTHAGCNSGDVGQTHLLSHFNCQASATGGDYATAVGGGAAASGAGSTAVGVTARSWGPWSTAIGSFPNARGAFATAIGSFAGIESAVQGATALGANAGRTAAGKFSTAIGAGTGLEGPEAAGGYSIAIGGGDNAPFSDKFLIGARATRFLSVAIGTASLADSDFAMAMGFNARAGAGADIIGPIAMGPDALATLTNAVALGRFSAATAEDTTALGSASAASLAGSLAIGFGAKANKKNAVALGSRSVANVANTVSVGRVGAERRIMNVAPALLNTDAVNLAQVKTLVAMALAQAQGTAQAVSVAPAIPRTIAPDADQAIRRELAELHAIIRQQQTLLEQQRAMIDEQQQRLAVVETRKAAR